MTKLHEPANWLFMFDLQASWMKKRRYNQDHDRMSTDAEYQGSSNSALGKNIDYLWCSSHAHMIKIDQEEKDQNSTLIWVAIFNVL